MSVNNHGFLEVQVYVYLFICRLIAIYIFTNIMVELCFHCDTIVKILNAYSFENTDTYLGINFTNMPFIEHVTLFQMSYGSTYLG